MRLRECLTITALLTVTMVSAKASPPAAANASRDGEMRKCEATTDADSVNDPSNERVIYDSEVLSAAPSPLVAKDKVLGSAYFNTLRILNTNNACSDFFGGPAAAVDVFRQLVGRVRKDYFAAAVGMTLSGETTNVSNGTTKKEYRLFDKLSINTNGPFYRKRISQSEPAQPHIGTFAPNTKEVRVLMFLHELGHLIKGEDGKWLLPNDGKDAALSGRNSQKIEDVCGEQIKGLNSDEVKPKAQPNKVHQLEED